MTEKETAQFFRIVLLAESSAVFRPDASWQIQLPDDSGRRALLTVVTRYTGDEALHVPRELVFHFEIEADHLDEAITVGTEASSWLRPIIAFATNAEVGEPRIHVAYELQSSSDEGLQFVQFYRHFRDENPQRGRFIDTTHAEAVVAGVGGEDEQRLWRCLSHYAFALEHWTFGSEFLVLNHLWIGVENLSKAALRHISRSSGKSEQDLAISYGLDTEDKNWKRDLMTEIRQQSIFQGDQRTHQLAKLVSDGFEHGFRAANELQTEAAEVCDKVFDYLRKAVLDVLQLPAEITDEIQARKPLDWRSTHKFVHGWLVGDPSQGRLGSPDALYPQLIWRSDLNAMKINDDESVSYTFEEKLTPQLREGVQFKLKGIGAGFRPLISDVERARGSAEGTSEG
ncbi:hypothetical protein [Arthrobacter sp. CG_A4]|uniref:hypothetical protein n=1 Tax=Arthrobacter sp. CG_A4 TaxID=3071706 RepID=UPI002DF8341F|nr:hypothetical protein [Arthrobacter sp. CG_A4]